MNRPERIAIAIKRSGKKKSEIAAACGVTPSSVTQWTTGDTQAIKPENLAALAAATGTTMEWLATGDGPMEAPAKTKAIHDHQLQPIEVWDDNTPLDDDEVELPLYKSFITKSGSGYATQDIYDEGRRLRFGKYSLRKAGINSATSAGGINRGDSNHPLIQDGAMVMVDSSKKQIVDGEPYALFQEGEFRVKFLYRLPGGGLRLRSYNREEYPDEDYQAGWQEFIQIEGWVWTWAPPIRKWRGS